MVKLYFRFTLGGSAEPPEPLLDPHQHVPFEKWRLRSKRKREGEKEGAGGRGREKKWKWGTREEGREGRLAQRQRERGKPKRLRDSLSKFRNAVSIYRKIPIISPGLIFGQKAFSPNFSWGGGGLYSGGGLIHGRIFAFWKRYFLFKQLYFFEIFCTQPVFITDF